MGEGEKMEKLLRSVYENKKKMKMCLALSTICAYSAAVLFISQLLLHTVEGKYITLAVVAGMAGVGFVAVTVSRKLVNSKRPYEVYLFYTEPPRTKKGEAHPSRHCYSASVIAVLGWIVSPWMTLGVGVLACIISVTRVVTGIHYIRDVIAGLLLGATFGALGHLILFLI